MSDYDVTAEIAYDLLGGRNVIHVRYRPHRGGRFYTRFTLVPDPGETFDAVCATIEPAVVAHANGNVTTPADELVAIPGRPGWKIDGDGREWYSDAWL